MIQWIFVIRAKSRVHVPFLFPRGNLFGIKIGALQAAVCRYHRGHIISTILQISPICLPKLRRSLSYALSSFSYQLALLLILRILLLRVTLKLLFCLYNIPIMNLFGVSHLLFLILLTLLPSLSL
jgi:hypothetical protein